MNPWDQSPWQGGGRRPRSFEGWYFKQVTADRSETWSFIPGLARGPQEAAAFVQVIEGSTARTWWFEYPAAAFSASKSRLEIRVGGNRFSAEGLELDLGEGLFSGRVDFEAFTVPPRRVLAPGVMGPYSFAPFMECRHGLVSLDHGLTGSFVAEGRKVDFQGGRGYAEKDWGTSLPSRWVWSQSNNFPTEGDSFMFSLARVPWLGSAFDGFLCVARLGGAFLLETTWTGGRIEGLSVRDDRAGLAIVRGRRRIEVSMRRNRAGLLRAPVEGVLSRRIAESVDAELSVSWREGGELRFEGLARNAGLEVVGDWASS